MRNGIRTAVVIILLLVPALGLAGIFTPTGKITVKAVDPCGQPIPDAYARVTFYTPKGLGKGLGTNHNTVRGKTDVNGFFTASAPTIRTCGMGASKEGYYGASKSFTFTERSFLNRWKPWNPTVEVKLKEARNPVPMYAKRTQSMKIPAVDTPVGYDLEKGDWVVPYGEGIISDFIFTFYIRFPSNRDWDCSYTLTFSNADDGIQEYTPPEDDFSSYRWPYEAPEEGYSSNIRWADYYYPSGENKSDYKKDRRYIFRVRTKRDEAGKITEARFGKINGDIEFFPNGKIRFTYYFNPGDNRSLEYDTERSLFKWPRRTAWEHEVTVP